MSFKSFLLMTVMTTCMVFFVSCNPDNPQNPEIEGMIGPKVELAQDYMKIDTVFKNVQITGAARMSFEALGLPEYTNSYIELGEHVESGGTQVIIYIALPDIIFGDDGGITTLDPQALPDGRPLPGIEGGLMPSIAFQLEELNDIGFYVNRKLMGIFYPMPDLQIGVNNMISFRYYSAGTAIGNITLVGQNQDQEGSGVLLMLKLDKKMKKYLKKYYKKWKKNN